MTAAAKHLRELLAKATPPPWLNQTPMTTENIELAMALVNAAPELLALVDCAHVYAYKGSWSGFQDLRKALAKLDEVAK